MESNLIMFPGLRGNQRSGSQYQHPTIVISQRSEVKGRIMGWGGVGVIWQHVKMCQQYSNRSAERSWWEVCEVFT